MWTPHSQVATPHQLFRKQFVATALRAELARQADELAGLRRLGEESARPHADAAEQRHPGRSM